MTSPQRAGTLEVTLPTDTTIQMTREFQGAGAPGV